MTRSGASLYFFGIYVCTIGLLFILIPNTVISLTQLPAMPIGWAKVLGLLTLVVGTYDILCGKNDIKLVIKASIYTRFGFTLGTILLVTFGQMPWTLLLLGSVDAVSALWTTMELKSEASKI